MRIAEGDFLKCAESSDGLWLLQSLSSVSPSRCRVSFPPLLQYLEFPGPQNPSLCSAIEFIPSTRAVELVSVHEDENQVLGYEVVHIGPIDNIATTTIYSWQELQVPELFKYGERKRTNLDSFPKSAAREGVVLFFRRGVAYCIWAAENNLDIHVDILDMVNESYIGHTTLSVGTFISDGLNRIQLLDWNGQLSFAEVVNDELHVLVLDDYRKKQHR
ncbi:hypothetical protein A4A49_22859 [Nicotiana attenuata]|uniref:Uncharacterized protein n=1 Tax=Nicotiana attenuata TaxID=49451 RepID=A0A314KIM9_NICAT|nr:hypothetical protein A4A49_22859 [Nicotiana attenuata]